MLLIRYLVLYSVTLYQFGMTIPWYKVGIQLHVFFMRLSTFLNQLLLKRLLFVKEDHLCCFCRTSNHMFMLYFQSPSLLVPLLAPYHHNWVVIGKSNSCYIVRHVVLPLYFCEAFWVFACSCFNIHFRMSSLSLNKTKTLRNVERDCIELLDQFGKTHLYIMESSKT